MPSLMAAQWVGQNSGPIFRRFWTKDTELSLPLRNIRSLQRRFPIDDVLLRSGDIRDQVAKVCEIEPKFWCFWSVKFREEGPSKLLTKYYKCESPSNMWQSLVTIGQATSEIRRRTKEWDVNYSGKTEWPAAIMTI